MADIFLSYAKQDRDRVSKIAKRLEEAGWSVFWDVQLLPGQKWDSLLYEELQAAKAVVVAWSHNSIKSEWVREEATYAKERGILVPVMIDDIRPPFGFTIIQAQLLTSWAGANDTPEVENLLEGIRRIFGGSPSPVFQPGNSARPVRTSINGGIESHPRPLQLENPHSSRNEIVERLCQAPDWLPGQSAQARRFFQAMIEWRRLSFRENLKRNYDLYRFFDPDDDALLPEATETGIYRRAQEIFIKDVSELLENTGYERIDKNNLGSLLTSDSTYGLDLHLDLDDYEEILIYTRNPAIVQVNKKSSGWLGVNARRADKKIARRVFLLIKLKKEDFKVREVMAKENTSALSAKKLVKKSRTYYPVGLFQDEKIYIKIFKNIVMSDIEMIFPNTRVKFKTWDKFRLGLGAAGGLAIGLYATATKAAILMNPYTAFPAFVGFAVITFRQLMNLINLKQRYMIQFAQNLYGGLVADNRNALTVLSNQFEEEETAIELALYSILHKERVKQKDFEDVGRAIEQYMLVGHGLALRVNAERALRRLETDGIARLDISGAVTVLPPEAAHSKVDELWAGHLKRLAAVA